MADKYGIPNALGAGGAYLAPDGAGGGGGASQTFLRAILEKISARLGPPVANEAALAAITANNRTDSMLVFVKNSVTVGPSIWYRDDTSAASATAGSVVTSTDSTTGRWLILATQAELTGGASAPQKASVTVAFGALAAGNSNGLAVSANLGAALPANARILGAALRLTTPFTGGGATAVTVDIGTAGDPIAIVAAADALHAAVDGMAFTQPAGKAPNKFFATSAQLLARFTPDGSHTLLGLTAGSITIDVLYSVLP
jgi:hypothetical protein